MLTSATGLRSVDFAVRDLEQSKAFYQDVWGLREVCRENGSIYMRATGRDHHVLGLHEAPRSALRSVNLAAPDRAGVDALHGKASSTGADIVDAPHALPAVTGGGYGFSLRSPEGQMITISADVAEHDEAAADSSQPKRLSHVVLNAARYDEQLAFFRDVLGFRLSDTTDIMDFLRCCTDHHSVALARAQGASLNHLAYELPDVEGLLKGAGRLRHNGFEIGWGIGRHGPGDNVFSYFIEPSGFVTEYTTGMEQVDNEAYDWHGPAYWETACLRPCRWGLAGRPTPEMSRAMGGELVEERNQRCEQIIARSSRLKV